MLRAQRNCYDPPCTSLGVNSVFLPFLSFSRIGKCGNRRPKSSETTAGKSASHQLLLSAFVLVSSIWLQFIWVAVGSTVKTRDLVKLNNNSIPTAPTNLLHFTAFVFGFDTISPFDTN
jgi:hypothetical protein